MRVNIDRQIFYGLSALVLQFLSEHEDLVEDEELKAVVLKIKNQVRAPLRTYYLSNPNLRLIMKRLVPALTGEKMVNTVLEIQSDVGNVPAQKQGSIRRIVKTLLNKESIDEDDFDIIVEHHGLSGKVDYIKEETYEERKVNLPLKYLDKPIGVPQ